MRRFAAGAALAALLMGLPPSSGRASAQDALSQQAALSTATASAPGAVAASAPAPEPVHFPTGFAPFRGVHMTSWSAGSSAARRRFLERAKGTLLNGVVVPVKEMDGLVYIPGVAKAEAYGTYRPAIPDPASMLADMKAAGLRAVARVVVFKDNTLPRKRHDLGIGDRDGGLWKNDRGVTWVDPYLREVWDYNVEVALKAAEWGFSEIQFDYIRFPSDGPTRRCRYSRAEHSRELAVRALKEFLVYAGQRLRAAGVPMSVAIFGMTTSAKDDLGIGQQIGDMIGYVDAVSPMMYPSHYAKGEYGLRDPNSEPYKVVFRGLRDAKAKLRGEAYKLRPYLQDFSLGYRYGPAQVRAELAAAKNQGIESWILWNPGNRYTWEVLRQSSVQEP